MTERHGPTGQDIAVVGIGAVFPGAPNARAFWQNIEAGVDAITEVPATRWDPSYFQPDLPAASDRMYCRRGGFVDDLATFDPAAYGIMPVAAAGSEPDQLLALRVATEAIADAGGEDRLPDRSRVGVILGRGGYLSAAGARLDQRVRTAHQLVTTLRELVPGIAEDQLVRVREAFQERLGPDRPEAAIGLVPNLAASRIANRLDLHGPAYVVDAACASALVAVDLARSELATGRCDLVIAGGVHHTHDIVMWSVFTQLGAISRRQMIRPFHREADGLLIGEGTGMVVLKRFADAERDGDRIYAVIRGTGVSSDGRAASLMAPRMEGQVLAVERAWRSAGLNPAEPNAIGLLEAHGTATPAGDQTELATLTSVFGPVIGAAPDIGIGSVKSMIGHAMPAAGIAGLIKAICAVHHGVLPPTLHCEEPHPGFAGSRFVPITEARPWNSRAPAPRRAAVDAFGFGGINAHVIVERPPDGHTVRRRLAGSAGAVIESPDTGSRRNGHSSVEGLLLLVGAGPEEIARQLEAGDEALLAQAATLPRTDGGPARLAIVGPNAQRIALARKIVARATPWRGRNDIHFAPRPLLTDSSGLAFVFPGLEAGFEPRVDEVASHFGLPVPALRHGEDFIDQAVDLIAMGRILAAALGELGVVPGALTGHSLGEWTAMIVGGLYQREGIDAFLDSLRPGFASPPDLVYGALGCSAAQATAALGDLMGPDGVALTHDNCPHQSVICGRPDRIDAAITRLRGVGVLAQVVPVRTGFHSPMIEPFLGPAHQALRRLPLGRPHIPVWSATSLEPFPDAADEIRALVIRHLIESVRFRQLIERLHARGVVAFVQVGPGSLPGFIEDTLRGREHLAVSADVPERGGLDQLRTVAAALWVAGLAPRFERLPGARPPGAPRGTTMRLDLGNPLIHFDGALPPLATSSERPSGARVSGDPVLAELDALVAEVTADAQAVVEAWRTSGGPPAPVTPAGDAVTRVKGTTTQVFSLERMPELLDHSLRPVPPGWPDPSDGFPVVPLTVMLEVMADAARDLIPGRAVIGWVDVRALRWLAVAPPTTATIRAVAQGRGIDGVDRVAVTIEGHSSGTVLLAARYPELRAPSCEPLTGERPPVVDAPEVYTEHWAFHGPRFAGVANILCSADNGHRGVVVNLPTRGALLDAAGQLIGHWAQISLDADKMVFPVGFAAIHLYGPHPAVGELLTQTVWIREVTARQVRADAELVDGSGRLWARIEGWTDHRFASDEVTWPMKFAPESRGVGEMQTGGWCLVKERWPDSGSRELAMRGYLCSAERAEYTRLDPIAQRRWLLGRIAAKDAVRNWLWARGGGPIYPCELAVLDDEAGSPHVSGGRVPRGLRVSIAATDCRGRTPGFGVAVAGIGSLGIDIQALAERDGDPATTAARFSAAERAVAEALGPPTRPGDLVVTDSTPDGVLTVALSASDHPVRRVRTTRVGAADAAFVVAWTDPASEDTEEEP
ncbi:beta-ketoacyl synthase N-terminal-like domain-containing protein [Nocardia sp. NPDC059239]|uniref:beta-ketoacyl synthase N-terminal-like domain-containing protein n=1 Tax=unclassified Nocardia TaxID=2637762 RepID=UPI0036D11B60